MEDDGDYGTFMGRQDKHAPLLGAPATNSRKWLMVGILSVLTAVNQGICYSYAPIASIAETRWEQKLHSTELITVYFVSYIPCSFFGSWLMDKKGLRYGVLLGGFLQALGAFVRYFATFSSSVAVEAYVTLFGQVLASIAMPFMVNSPPVLSANWFPPSLRATSTSIAVNANAMGTAFIYITAPFVVHSADSIPAWNLAVAIVAMLSFVVAIFFFRSFPSPTHGEAESVISDVQLHEEYDWTQWANAFLHRGFWHTVVAFSVAECIVNAMSALLGKFLATEGFSKIEIGIIGAAFIVSSLVGSQIISRHVDEQRNHQLALQVCLVLTAVFLAAFKATLSIGDTWVTLGSLMIVGAFLGPLQPIVLELGVECAFPTSEATVAALQQLCGNFLSAILVPGMSVLRRSHTDATGHVPAKYFYATPEWVMVAMLLLTFIIFCFYNGEYKRFNHEAIFSPKSRASSTPSEPALPVVVKPHQPSKQTKKTKSPQNGKQQRL
ncbi:hypothetical protein Poli38472_004821 [Pythium oligandrum]|uniref:Major facilitator superfamily (MFS) profile domain-containing protein n=1 Tax=Pythium oligandrum TaxID=41045 RepID=A0A8K1CAT4_PYTOL|nr:hypothetical protein Poli38472_004821 [Pythium oligandrum]|eukprot:TMW59752.1 hypothetical protein Poli38472_004821 [Pythium oligandrum]